MTTDNVTELKVRLADTPTRVLAYLAGVAVGCVSTRIAEQTGLTVREVTGALTVLFDLGFVDRHTERHRNGTVLLYRITGSGNIAVDEALEREQRTTTTPPEAGYKPGSDSKTRYDLVPAVALEGAAAALTHGAHKHGDQGYLQAKPAQLYAAAQRHLWTWWNPDVDTHDDETGLSHLDHAIADLMMLRDLDHRINQ